MRQIMVGSFTKIFLTQRTVMTAFGQSNLIGCVSVRHFYNRCSSKSRNGASQNQPGAITIKICPCYSKQKLYFSDTKTMILDPKSGRINELFMSYITKLWCVMIQNACVKQVTHSLGYWMCHLGLLDLKHCPLDWFLSFAEGLTYLILRVLK